MLTTEVLAQLKADVDQLGSVLEAERDTMFAMAYSQLCVLHGKLEEHVKELHLKSDLFAYSQLQHRKAAEWMEAKRTGGGVIGGQFTLEFTPTSVGPIQKIRDCNDGKMIDLTDYESW